MNKMDIKLVHFSFFLIPFSFFFIPFSLFFFPVSLFLFLPIPYSFSCLSLDIGFDTIVLLIAIIIQNDRMHISAKIV